jgi:hypothetical protein
MHKPLWKKRLFTCALVLIASIGQAAEKGAAMGPEAKPAKFYVQAGKIKKTYTCAEGVEAGSVEKGVVHANLEQGAEKYLLLGYSEPSRPGNANARCGGGIEAYLVWLHIRGNTVLEAKTVQHESCWKDISGGKPAWTGKTFGVEYEAFTYNQELKDRVHTRTKAEFDAKAPEKGIVVTDLPVEKAK